jgi:Cof subfamily protein (haloacid dehalogenase superfamily)
MRFDLIAFDLDGTTLNNSSTISKKNYSALSKAYEMGVKLVPCTGRSMYELPEEINSLIDEFGFSVFPCVITDNGAQVYDLSKKELLYSKNIPKTEALKIIVIGRSQLALTYGTFSTHGATDNKGIAWESEAAKPYIKEYHEKWGLPVADLEELIEWNDSIVKISMNFLYEADRKKCFDEFSLWPSLALSSAAPLNIEFMSAGICKGEALKFVSLYQNIPLDRVMAIGDNINDIEMIQAAGFGIAMGNAIPELKEKADWITADNDEDGLALAIEKILKDLKDIS